MNWMNDVKKGDRLSPKPRWNQTSNANMQLSNPTEIIAVMHDGGSQSGIQFFVRSIKGRALWLDADWFIAPISKHD